MGVPLHPFSFPWRGRFCCCQAGGPGSPDKWLVLCCKLTLCARVLWCSKSGREGQDTLDCWSGCCRKQVCFLPSSTGTDSLYSNQGCAKRWWHELRGSCSLLLHGMTLHRESSATNLSAQIYLVLFGLSAMKQTWKARLRGGRFTWTQILKEKQGKYDLHPHLLDKRLYHMLWAVSVLLAMILTAGGTPYDKEAMDLW